MDNEELIAELAVIRAELDDALSALGPEGSPQRETWRLMYVEDRTVAEVAELTGVPAGTVKSRAYQIRRPGCTTPSRLPWNGWAWETRRRRSCAPCPVGCCAGSG